MNNIFRILAFAGALLIVTPVQAQTLNQDYKQMLARMYRKTVPLITVAEAAKWSKLKNDLVFLDTREQNEFAVSHIKGAKWVGYKDFKLSRLQNISHHTPIILYCSVGYRSEKVGEQLLKAGYTNVHNLYGSLFEWVNQGYPVYNNLNQPTTEVHTYSKRWGKWLQKGKKVY